MSNSSKLQDCTVIEIDDEKGLGAIELKKLNGKESPIPDLPKQEKIAFLCFDLGILSPLTQASVLIAGVIFFFMTCSFVEEYAFAILPKFQYGWFMTFFELLCFGGFSCVERMWRGDPLFAHRAPFRQHWSVAIFMTASRGLTNVSLQYLNYPTQVIFKSMKLITVMIGSVAFYGKRYERLEYVAASMLVLSAILFSLGDADVSPKYSTFGLVVVLLSLVFDSLHSNSQDHLVREAKASMEETMMFTNWFACILSLLVIIFNGEFIPSLEYCSNYPIAYIIFIIRALVIYFGVYCFVLYMKIFGVVSATSVTTVRKILTIIASFIVFPKELTVKYLYGFILFCGGVALNVRVMQNQRKV